MLIESIVYWAPPYEIPSLKNTSKNMVTNNLVKTRLILNKILNNINSGDKVAIKVHVGESYNTRYLRHDYVREVVNAIKSKGGVPTLVETQGLGTRVHDVEISENYSISLGYRRTADKHEEIARLHGYTESIVGAPLKFMDGDKGIDDKIVKIDGLHFKDVSVAAGLFEFDKLVVVSHFKGHPQAGFGGALKQLGIGSVTKRNKSRAHFEGVMSINTKVCNISKCNQECVKSCPVNAIEIEQDHAIIDPSICIGCGGCAEDCPIRKAILNPDFVEFKKFTERLIDNATAVITSFGPEKIRYINFAIDITLMCDCIVNPNMSVVPDLGIFGSSDPVAIDKACIDAETNAPGLPVFKIDGKWSEPIAPGVEKFKAMASLVDPLWQIDAAVKSKIGTTNYKLVKII